MRVDLSAEEVSVLLGALNMVPVQGTEAMRRVLALVAKMEAVKDGEQEAAQQQGATEAVEAGQGQERSEEGVAMSSHSKHKKGKRK